ncbi:MotA/TolQ/ExbB proton channel family protein [Myroides phaeus]|uniref:MotA/TolQ/ExbB proton channel family protein n=1 Tax=Myroides phaeus TaxID=702745 RepID=UPI002DBCE36D|nr:MotA/TolQ/ExbB proton channel family protein [Myroides phaeus]MEC4117225.1 MotA/TolQ/ExbB proton channel family protein [Myroides phaeus]
MFHFLQVDITAVAQNLTDAIEKTEGAVNKELALSDIIFSGGIIGQSIMVVIFIMLFMALYLYLERFFAIKKASKVDESFMSQIKLFLSQGKIDQAKVLCAHTDTPVARLVGKGISRIGKPLQDINIAIENAGKLEVYKMEKNINLLATLSGAGPMTGFLGTVVGMVMAFHEMSTASSARIDMSVLAEGIYTAMMTTVFGLIVGIIAYVGYNHLVSKIDKIVHQLEANAVEFLDLLNEPA